jgi:hypothetical protein
MTRKSLLSLAVAAGILLAAGVWLDAHRARQQSDIGGGAVFGDLGTALGDITEIRLSKGDGSRTTLKRAADGWTVAERNYPADGSRVRELALNLAAMKVVEAKTSDPANYAKLGVEPANSPTATSTLVELVGGKKTWSLLVGKSAGGRAVYVRKPDDKTSALAEPSVSVDPDQKRWLDRQVTDISGADVHDIAVTPARGPAYLLTRAKRGDTDLALSPVPKGRNPVTPMSLNGQAEALAAFNFDDVHPLETPAPASTDKAVWRTFDGQVIELAGRRTADKAFVTVNAHRDPALAAQFAAPATPAAPTPGTAAPAAAASPATATPAKPADAKPAEKTVERLASRANGVQYEIPGYKYDALFKPEEDLLEKLPAPAAKPARKPESKPVKKQ